jgi:hypothetical protein
VILVALWTCLAISAAHAGKSTKPSSSKHGKDPGSRRLLSDPVKKERTKAWREKEEPTKRGKIKKVSVRNASY